MGSLFKLVILALFGAFALPTLALAAEGGVSPKAYELFKLGPVTVTNSMVTTWAIGLIIIVVVRVMVASPKLIPSKGQAVVESVALWVQDIMEPIIGHKVFPKVFPLLVTLFVFILLNNWSGLMPGVGAFGFYDGSTLEYFFRPANSDLNTTIALACVAMLAWLYFVIRYAGLGVLIHEVFGNKADKRETPKPLFAFLGGVFFLVGIIELVSIAIRPVTLSMRLYGNIFGGERLLDTMVSRTVDVFFIPVAMPFYLLETLVGLIQALVFTLLVAVYIGLVCNHEEGEHH
ncbi:MAG: F0F1 ATP synthase subunit A [Opitutales bacterium]